MASSRADARRLAARIALAASLMPGVAISQTLDDCARLHTDAVRLACYDRVVGRGDAAKPPDAAPAPERSAATSAPIVVPSTPAAPSDAGWSEPSPGRPRIESRILGHFEGWEPRTRFTLENGQVWENAGNSSRYYVTESPSVTIEPGSFGSWFLSVEGLSARTAVRRVR